MIQITIQDCDLISCFIGFMLGIGFILLCSFFEPRGM